MAPASSGVGGAPGDSARRRSTSRPRASAYVFALFAFQSAFVSVESVKQPTETSFRTAHGTSATTHAPMQSAGASTTRRCQSTKPAQTSGRKSEPRVAEDREREHDAERDRTARTRRVARSAAASVR